MAKSYEELKAQAAVIKKETSDGANTAKRIGTMFEDAIDFTDANIGQSVGLIVTDYKGTPEDTRMSVDARFRKKGSVMTYNPGTGYIMEQYIGTTLLDSEWQKGTNWRPYYADENIQNIAEYARSAGEEAQAAGVEAKQIAQAAANEASTQAAYAKEQGDRLSNIDLSLYRVVIELPSIPSMSDDDMNKIYLKVSAKQGENNKYDEFVVVNNAWELLGQYEAAIDLTDYVGKDELSSEIAVLPALGNISKFVCIDENGETAGVMTKEQVAQVVGELIGTVTSGKNGLVDRDNDMYCRDDIPQDLNDSFAGFGRADNKTNAPASYGIVVSFYTQTKGNYIAAQLYFSNSGTIYGRMKWESWGSWRQLT